MSAPVGTGEPTTPRTHGWYLRHERTERTKVRATNTTVTHVIERIFDRWTRLDSDWQGVVVGAAIVAAVWLFGITVPW